MISALLFSACFKVSLTGIITPEYTAIYQVTAEIDLNGFEYSQQMLAQESLIKLHEYWSNIGYDSQISFDNEKYAIYFKTQKQCLSYEEAFEELYKLMTDYYSPLQALSYSYISYENYSQYQIKGSMDISHSLDNEVYDLLQENIKKIIEDEKESINANITFVLPNQENLTQDSSMTKSFVFDISPYRITEFEFSGNINNPDIVNGNISSINKFNYYKTLQYILGIVFIIILFATFYLINKFLKKK